MALSYPSYAPGLWPFITANSCVFESSVLYVHPPPQFKDLLGDSKGRRQERDRLLDMSVPVAPVVSARILSVHV